MALGAVIDDLINPDAELKPSLLSRLSALLPEEQEELRAGWSDIPAPRRLGIVEGIIGMAEDDIELDFLPVLHGALQDDEAEVRAAAASGLWETDDRIVITPLLGLLETDESPTVRASAASALGHFVELAEAGKLIERDASRLQEALVRALKDDEEETIVRRRALEAIAPLGHPSIGGWVRWAYKCDDPSLRQSAVYAMGRTCDPAWLSVIVEEMESVDPAMRFEAANAARELADPEALPYLHELVGDLDTQVAMAAVHAIGGIGGAMAKKLLKRYVDRGEGTVSEAAEEALRALETDEMDFTMLNVREEA